MRFLVRKNRRCSKAVFIWSSAIKSTEIVLPVKSDGTPDFDDMEWYIRTIEKRAIADVAEYKDRMIAAAKQVINI